jgi:hypothetical protein
MHQLHEPDSTRQIETIVDGEPVRGTVHLIGSSKIDVTLDWPPTDLSAGSSMSFFSRVPPGEPGYLGKYGETLAMNFLLSLHERHKRGDRRRQFAGAGFREFGRVRYLATKPGYPERGVRILEKTPLGSLIYVQIESDGPYRRARLFDSGTDQPFLAESAVYEKSVQAYVDGVKADPGFSRHLETVRLKLLPEMIRNDALLKNYSVNPYQADFLNDFGKSWRTGYMPLNAAEIDELIQLGYLIRDRVLAATERIAREASLARTRKAMENFAARGKEHQAAECRTKMHKLERRMDANTLRITPAGKATAKKLTHQVGLD